MKSAESAVSRRFFLRSLALCFSSPIATQFSSWATPPVAQIERPAAQLTSHLLDLVNGARASAAVSRLMIDDLAASVAQQHAVEMVTGQFLSHWSRDGRKPYHRYSFAGGFDAVQENISEVQNLESLDPEFVRSALTESHLHMMSETAPDDGHRRTILAPQHTHVGFGVASSRRELRLVELFVAKYISLAPYPARAQQNEIARFKGKISSTRYALQYVEVFFEPLPAARDLSWLRVRRSYSLPDDFVTLRPQLAPGIRYADGTRGVVDTDVDGRFQFVVRLNRKSAGIYTVVIWIGTNGHGEKFPATNACIHVE
jgi:uncharacterized protein YkwD